MKRLVLLFALFVSGLCAVIVPSAIADKPPAPPGQGECNHGNSNQPCKPDPSTNGKDCDPHGNNGGTNEDHCLATTTTNPSTSTTTTDPSTTTTTSTGETTTTRETTSTTSIHQTTSIQTETSTTSTTGTTTTDVAGTTTTTSIPKPDKAPTLKSHAKKKSSSSIKGQQKALPFTGIKLPLIAAIAILLLFSGILLRRKDMNGPRT